MPTYRDRATVLLDILRVASSGADLTEVIDGIGEELARLVPFDRLSVVLPDPESEYVVSYAFTTDSPGDRLRLPVADTSVPRVMAGECFILDLEQSPHASERALVDRLGLRSAIYAPLVAGEHIVGILVASSLQAGAYEEQDLAVMCEVGRYLGVIVEHAVLAGLADEAALLRERLHIAARFHNALIRDLGEVIWMIDDRPMDAEAAARRLIAGARNLLWDLEPASLTDVGLVPAVSELARRTELKGTLVTIDLDGEQPSDMDRRCAFALFNVAREALGNVTSHASANRVAIHLGFGPAEVALQVTDDGRGFDIDEAPGGRGLSVVQERVNMVGGTVEVRSAPGLGTKVVAIVPFQPAVPQIETSQPPAILPSGDILVIVADHQEAVRRGLGAMVDSIPGLSTVGQAADADALRRLLEEQPPDLVLIDLDLPGASTEMAGSFPEPVPQIVIVSAYDRDERIFRWLEAGARGHVVRDIQKDDLARAIRTVHAGGSLLPPVTTRRLLDRLDAATDELTERELQVLREMATGATNKTIAERLYIGAGTVKFHVANILRKLEAANRTEAVAEARRRRLID